jgi:hypothetical protein
MYEIDWDRIKVAILQALQSEQSAINATTRCDAFDEAIAHFTQRAEHCPDQTIRHEAVVAILSSLKNNFWVGSIDFHKYLAQAAKVEIFARFTSINGDTHEIPLSSDATRPVGT